MRFEMAGSLDPKFLTADTFTLLAHSFKITVSLGLAISYIVSYLVKRL